MAGGFPIERLLQLRQLDTPSDSPEAGYNYLYFKNDGKLYRKAGASEVLIEGSGENIVVTNVAPTVTDDINAGNFEGQRWIDTTRNAVYILKDDTAGAAEWERLNFPPHFDYQNVKVVQTLADFPAPVGRFINLEDKTYLIDALKLDITGYTIVYGQRSAIQGFNQNVSSIQSFENGATLFKSTKNLFMNDVEIYMSAPNQMLFDCQGDGTTPEGESFELNRMAVYCQDDLGAFQSGCKAGIIKDIRQGFMGTQFFLGFQDGFKFAGAWAGGMRIVSTLWAAFGWGGASGKVYYSDPLDPVSFSLRFFSDAAMTINGSNVGYDFPETAFVFDGQYQLQGGNVSGSGTYVTDFTSGFPAFDPLANFRDNSGIQNSYPGGEFVNSVNVITTITTQNVWVQAALTTINKDLTWTLESNGVFTYNSDNALDAFLIYTLSLTGKANDIVEVKVVKEDALLVQTDLIVRPITIQGTTTQGRAESVPISTTGRFVKGDKIIVYYRNTSGTSDVTTLSNSNGIISAK